MADVGQVEGEVLRRAGGEQVAQVEVALPVTPVLALLPSVGAIGRRMGAIDAAAADIAGHEAQAGNAEQGQVEVVTGLPGAFMGAVEVGVLDRVGEVDRVAAHEVEGGIALDLLVGEGKGLAADLVLRQQAPGQGIDGAGTGVALVAGLVQVAVERQGVRLNVQVEVALAPGVVQLRGVESGVDRRVGRQGGADEADGAAPGGGSIAVEVAVPRAGVLVLEAGEASCLEAQVGDGAAVE
ncbi:hypothetical protein D9M70_461140 [compost metagenome]